MAADKKSAAGDAPSKKKGKEKEEKGKGKEEKGKEEKGKDKGKGKDEKGKEEKGKGKDDKGKGKVEEKGVHGKGRPVKEAEPEAPVELPPTPSQIVRDEAEYRAARRKQNLRKRPWPEVTKVKINTKPWTPPPPPEKPPKVMIELPPLETRRWVPPWQRRRKERPRLPRCHPEDTALPNTYESALKKIWHGFTQVDTNKMMLQGTIACNSKRYLAGTNGLQGAQTGCIALVCRALLHDKTPAQLARRDVDDVILAGDQFYKQCTKNMKCYKGKPALELHQLLNDFYFRDHKYSVLLNQVETGVLAKHPDNTQAGPDLFSVMEKRTGQSYMFILTVNKDKHFLIWGHPPEGGGANVKTICYIFEPHALDEFGNKMPVATYSSCCSGGGAGAFLRYPGVTSFVIDFLGGYCDLSAANKLHPKPPITLTTVEIAHKEPIARFPGYELDLKTLRPHCRSEWEALNVNAMIDEKLYKGKWPFASLSAESMAVSRKSSKWKVRDFYQKLPKEAPPPALPVAPEKPPPAPTVEQLMALKGENFFLQCPQIDANTFGRDDMLPLPKSETMVHSPFELAFKNFKSQYHQLGDEKWILRATRHFASYRYQTFKTFTGVACCVAALAMLRKMRARGWNEDTLDETYDVGWNLFRDSMAARRGPIRRLVLGELVPIFKMRDKDFEHKERNVAVWGKLFSNSSKVYDICRGIDTFFKESDSGILQIPGEYETAIWYEGGRYYMYHPWPADRFGKRVGLQDGGKGCLLSFARLCLLGEHFLQNTKDLKRKPFSISDVSVWDLGIRPEPVNNLKAVGKDRWIVRGTIHEGDESFPEEHRNKQATPASIAAIAMATLVDPAEWTPADIDEILNRGDVLYEKTIETLDKMGINLETAAFGAEEEGGEDEEEGGAGAGGGVTGTLAAADVLRRFNISEYDSIETEVQDSIYSGVFNPEPGSGLRTLKESLAEMFKENKAAVVTARGGSVAVWKQDDYLYFFDPHGCDEYGLPSDEPLSGACLIRMRDDVRELADVIMGNLAPGTDDSYNISPVEVLPAKINPETGAPEIQKEGKMFDWLNKQTATILMGPRGENTAIGMAAQACHVPKDDLAGRTLALPAICAFAAATDAVQPPGMHQDHIFNFLDAGKEYYLNHVKNTGRRDITVEDMKGKIELGLNTFTLEIGEPTRLPLRLPDKPAEGGGEEEEEAGNMQVEGEAEPKEVLKEMKELLFKLWYDTTRPETVSLLLGDYHQLGVWMQAGGKVVVFDPAPTLNKGLLTPHRIQKGDELRLQRIKDEKSTEGAEDEEDEEAGGEEAQPEPEQFVPPESCPVLMIFASPGEFIDKLVLKGGLDNKQAVAPYWLYPVTVINELTRALKEQRAGGPKGEEAEAEEEDQLVEPLEDEAMGKSFERKSRTVASMRGCVAQNDPFFIDDPNRDNQDAAMAVMGIAVHHIEPYQFWKPTVVDAILKYGDRLYTMSLPNAKNPPRLCPDEVINEFRVRNFNVKAEVVGDVIVGDYKAADTGKLLNLKRGLQQFFNEHQYAVICAKSYCVAVWKAKGDKGWVYWDPHPVGPTGLLSPASAAGVVLYSTLDELADYFKTNLNALCRPGPNKYTISSVKVTWEFSPVPAPYTQPPALPDEPYEWKVLTAFVACGKGRTILRGSLPDDGPRYARDALLASAPTAIVAACMSTVRKPHLWTRKTIDECITLGCMLFTKSIGNLGYEFRPGEDILHPLQVPRKFVLGVNYVRYDMQSLYTGKIEQKEPGGMNLKCALESFFESHSLGLLWAPPHAVAVWRVAGAPCYYMMEPHSCTAFGLRMDPDFADGAACVQTFSSPKLMAFHYLQNLPTYVRYKRPFVMYVMSVDVSPIKSPGANDPPLVRPQRGLPPGTLVVPATSKVDVFGRKRRARESERQHPPGEHTWQDVMRAAQELDRTNTKYKGMRNSNGWLVLIDGTQFLSATHSMACKRYPYASRGNQALACSVMAVAMSAVEEVCRWCNTTLDQILDSGDQLYQDSYLHYHPNNTPILSIEQILRKFYTPGNCVCRVAVYKTRQTGKLKTDLLNKLKEFFREERKGVFVAYGGQFAVALFKTSRGFYMFDPADRDRYGRAVPPQLVGRSRACFSEYPSVADLADVLGPNIPPPDPKKPPPDIDADDEGMSKDRSSSQVRFDGKAGKSDKPEEKKDTKKKGKHPEFAIYGMDVSSLRRLNQDEK